MRGRRGPIPLYLSIFTGVARASHPLDLCLLPVRLWRLSGKKSGKDGKDAAVAAGGRDLLHGLGGALWSGGHHWQGRVGASAASFAAGSPVLESADCADGGGTGLVHAL